MQTSFVKRVVIAVFLGIFLAIFLAPIRAFQPPRVGNHKFATVADQPGGWYL